MNKQDYSIADFRMRLEGEDLIQIVNQIEGFTPFRVNVEGEPLITIITKITEKNMPAYTQRQYAVTVEQTENCFGTTATGYRFQMTPAQGDPLVLWGNPEDKVLYLTGIPSEPARALRAVRFALWIAFGMCTVNRDTIPVHSSTITYKDKNVLFLGESGTGKSTHTRLWRENIDGSYLLNDDSPILRIKENGEAWIYGSPWSGKTPCYKNESHRLIGCVRLSQAPYNRITTLRTLYAYAAIHPSCPPDFAYDKHLYEGISNTLKKLLADVPFFHLECLPNAEAAYLSCKTLFRD